MPGIHGIQRWHKHVFPQVSSHGIVPSMILPRPRLTRGVLRFAVVFGRVLEGYDIVDKVQKLPVDRAGRPDKPVVIAACGLL